MPVVNDFSLLDAPTLQSMLSDWQTCLKAVAGGQEYHIGNRSLTRANVREASQMVADLSRAYAMVTGRVNRNAKALFTTPYNGRSNYPYYGPT